MTYLGIDPSLSSSGLVLLDDKGKVLWSKVVKSKRFGDRPIDETLRLQYIVRDIISEVPVTDCRIAIEGIAFASSKTGHSAIVALNYLIRRELYIMGMFPLVIGPTQVKKWVGKGNADKKQVMKSVKKIYKFKADTDDEYDARIIAEICLRFHVNSLLDLRQHEVITNLRTQL